jgi:hypothetical protein
MRCYNKWGYVYNALLLGSMVRDPVPRLRMTRHPRRLALHPSTQEYHPMHLDEIIQGARELAHPYRITAGDTFRLQDIDPADTAGLEAEDKPRGLRRKRCLGGRARAVAPVGRRASAARA